MENRVPNHYDPHLPEMIQRILANHGVAMIEKQDKLEENIKLNLKYRFKDLSTDIKFLTILMVLLMIFFVILCYIDLKMFNEIATKQVKIEQKIDYQIKTINKQNQVIEQQQMLLKTLKNQIKNGN